MAYNIHNKQILLSQPVYNVNQWTQSLLEPLYCKKFRIVWIMPNYQANTLYPDGISSADSSVVYVSINGISTTKTSDFGDGAITYVWPQVFSNVANFGLNQVIGSTNSQWYDVPEGKFHNFFISLNTPKQHAALPDIHAGIPTISTGVKILLEVTSETC